MRQHLQPRATLSNGYARSESEARYPQFWRRLWFAHMPCLGCTGINVARDISGNARHAAFSNMTVTDWGANQGGFSGVSADYGNYNWRTSTGAGKPYATYKPTTAELGDWSESEGTAVQWLAHHTTGPSAVGCWSITHCDFNSHYPYSDGNIYDGTFCTVRQSVGAIGSLYTNKTPHMMAVTFRGGVYSFFQNETRIFQATGKTFKAPTTTNYMYLGGSSNGAVAISTPAYTCNYNLFGVAVWNRYMTDAEIAQLAALGPSAIVEPIFGTFPYYVAATGGSAVGRGLLEGKLNLRSLVA